jgi:hypothetical protein
MPGLPTTFMRHRDRLNEVAKVLGKLGFAAWVQRGSGLLGAATNNQPADQPSPTGGWILTVP